MGHHPMLMQSRTPPIGHWESPPVAQYHTLVMSIVMSTLSQAEREDDSHYYTGVERISQEHVKRAMRLLLS